MATTKPTSRNAQRRSGSSSSKGGTARTSQSQARDQRSDVAGRLKEAAKGPAVALGAAAAGVAGGWVLRNRLRRKRVLGVPLPRSLGRGSLTDIDLQSMAKTLGKASRQFGQTSKNVSKDIERVGDQAERIGKILD
jgi:hypothetical protein